MVIIGLTGGIASGKSFVASYLHKLDIPVIDADKIGHSIYQQGKPAYDDIVEHFGVSVLDETGDIDRKLLGKAVFGNQEKLKLLADITHPRIFEEQARQLQELHEANPNGVAVLEVALLIETGSHQMCDYILMTYCQPQQQKERMMERDSIDEAAAELRLKAQWPLVKKVPYADFLVDTSGDIAWSVKQLEELSPKLQALADEEEE